MINRIPAWLSVVRVAGLAVWLLVTLFPLYWILITSFKPASQIAEYPVRYWPKEFSFENYEKLTPADRNALQAPITTLAEDLSRLRGTLGLG